MAWTSTADKPSMDGNLQYHIRARTGDIAKYTLLPGDPERVDKIAAEWTEARFIAQHREHRTFTGRIGEVPISCCSIGSGGASTSSALEELANLGADTFIRVGSTGAIQPHIDCGDLIISAGALRQDGTSDLYVDATYPAFGNYELVVALVEAAESLGVRYHVGITCTTSSWYNGQGRPGFGGYSQEEHRKKIEYLQNAKILNFDMETATIYTLASLFGFRAASICVAVANRTRDELAFVGMENCIKVANRAVQIIAGMDGAKTAAGKSYWFPALSKSAAATA